MMEEINKRFNGKNIFHINFIYFRKLYIASALIISVMIVGIFGYHILEHYSYLDSFFMTVITVATVGYREVRELDPAGKIFTSILIIFSISTFAYAISVITRYVIEGEFQVYFKHYKVNKEIQKLKNHVIVCGYGRNGKQACEQLRSGNESFVAIENNPGILEAMRNEGDVLFIEGDATQDDVLEEAGLERAKALITALPNDAANVFVVLTARDKNPTLKIISRASDDASEHKLKRAGANNVIMPDKIGGTHMAALVTKPDVLEFIDHITGKINIRLEEIRFSSLPESMRNKSIRELEIRNKTGANIIGFKTAGGEYVINPPPDTIMMQDAKLFVLGTKEQVMRFKDILN
jgi:voltage-gated potassium channel